MLERLEGQIKIVIQVFIKWKLSLLLVGLEKCYHGISLKSDHNQEKIACFQVHVIRMKTCLFVLLLEMYVSLASEN